MQENKQKENIFLVDAHWGSDIDERRITSLVLLSSRAIT